MIAIEAVTTTGATAALCQSVGLARADPSIGVDSPPGRRRRPHARPRRARSGPAERQAVLDVLHSERFVDQSPAEVQATLLEEQTYLCSTRTMYRILDAAEEVRERRAQARHPAYAKPELVATAPNQIWSWDITKLKGPIPYLSDSLYVILDLFSRYVVGWMVAAHENAHLAQRLIEATCRKQHIGPQQLTIHAGPRRAEAQQARRALVLRPRHRGEPLAASGEQRQSLVRSPSPDGQIPPGLSGPLRFHRTRARDRPRSLRVVQRRASPQWPELSHARRRPRWGARPRSLRSVTTRASRPTPPHPERFVQGPPRGETLPTAVWINPPAKVPARMPQERRP